MAKGEKYSKFNNIQNKITVEDIIGRKLTKQDENNPEIQKIKVSVLKTNMKFGLESVTHRELEGYTPTLGFEIETCSGRIPVEQTLDLNMKAVHDGSLRDEDGNDPMGGEYVTGVLFGDSGFKHLYDICKVLNENCDIDHRAGVHVHIGNLKWTNEDVVYCYILAKMIEDEMYSMLPKSRSRNKYCRKLDNVFTINTTVKSLKSEKLQRLSYETLVDKLFNDIFMYVSGGNLPQNGCNKYSNHPRGAKCGYDTGSQRYCWMNFVTLLFNTKGIKDSWTLEIRSHSATLNYKKIKNWAKIWCAFTKFVSEKKDAILNGEFTLKGSTIPVNLENICLWAYPKTGQALVEYMRLRKKEFTSMDESIDWVTTKESNKSLKQVLEIN